MPEPANSEASAAPDGNCFQLFKDTHVSFTDLSQPRGFFWD